ncbi:TPA: 1-deoxy-D-xylulose-5-phosphate synthase [Candidatus Gastranaerophilales bacterium HUM_10]|nr:MAG TPA: 1-deoxy-D-xylulose-5-phosphate synthase [Candidatus Gastranaerophilales bacterium HUM_10]DAB13063.1 MAG TPA: 1-deoxy-D-xylulose-5-phosphate synthase [Candidatus Gastranaerophilales bacterium HUM_16]DAB18910.1 MAG TPA: 1-deoxy-D-xylulose-5-phosphate synthase [Candidatus Gastranaerophilales bacterium HUM_17]DAB25672.1 MAG TPA: 1-deoxy-D-xylulose-5-phosphate synthase [Candidatus Gastranaerophilales bacterium HUM_23]
MVLDKINTPEDLRGLSAEEMNLLSAEIRDLILKKVNTTGGHLGPNLGMVEATIALHRVFNSPVDKFVFDVSHQCYPHKILTGRKEGFTNPAKYHTYTGYTAPEESAHDLFKVGHTSTSVSLACGLAKARDLIGGKENVVAIIGDGSLTGGEALEGLNNAAVLGSNIIIVVNDNDMSIAENHGGLYSNLKLLRDTKGQAENNFFKTLGFDYYYIDNGHDFNELISVFDRVKDADHPVLVHMHTIKGKGLHEAEVDKEHYHWIVPGELDKKPVAENAIRKESYESITADYILDRASKDSSIIAISPATPGVSGFTPEFRKKLGKNYVDVGIAEEHAVAFASGLAKGGAKPMLAVMSSFIQRTYDQLSQDLALNNTPATLLIFWGGITGMDATHLSKYDIPLICNIPNIVYLAPVNKEEYISMMDWANSQSEHSVVIRVPFTQVISTGEKDTTDYSKINKYQVVESGSEVAILGLGNFFHLGVKVKDALKANLGISATLINPHFISGVDEELMESLKANHKLVITLEDGAIEGGFGEKIASYFGNSDMKVLNFGARKEFTDRVPLEELYQRYHLTPELIVDDIKNCL